MKQVIVRVKKNESDHTYEVSLTKSSISLPEAMGLLKRLKKERKAILKEVEKDGKTYWILEY